MTKWNYNKHADDEKMGSIDKIRSKRNKLKQASKEADSFIKPQGEWILGGEDGAFVARVVEVQKKFAFVSPEPTPRDIRTRDVWLGTVARRYLTPNRKERNLISVGDLVLCKPDTRINHEGETDLPRCVMTQMAPRETRIVRCDPMTHEREHILASNIDQLVVVASYLRPKIRFRLIDRFLVLAEEQNIPAILIFNKTDLLEDKEECSETFRETCRRYEELYRRLGYQVFSISSLALEKSKESEQFRELRDIFANKITILAGHSGVGKSSVVNLFKPEIQQVVEENPNIFYKGRHTTTYASFIRLGTGGFVVDTPGIRSFLLAERDVIGLSYCFREFRELKCKFRECRHIDEPDCGVLEALIKGDIDENRYRSYLAILSGESSREGKVSQDED